jgi:UPF0042 nucleotide-binding protein
MLKVLFVCGMSGAGKTIAQSALEDFGYMCIDNMPQAFIELVIDLVEESDEAKRHNIGFIFDVKFHEVSDLIATYERLKTRDEIDLQLLFLDADNKVLVGRYRETRRKHPLASTNVLLEEGIAKERTLLQDLKLAADVIIDTTDLSPKELINRMRALFATDALKGSFHVTFVSFGFKYGIPKDADFLLDVRFLLNPFYEKSLRFETGLDASVRSFVLESAEGKQFLVETTEYLTYLLTQYAKEKRNQFVVAIGCTGGQHRSVAIVEALATYFKETYVVFVKHRDMKHNQAEVKQRYEGTG